jgi:hypothetical protein
MKVNVTLLKIIKLVLQIVRDMFLYYDYIVLLWINAAAVEYGEMYFLWLCTVTNSMQQNTS